MREFDAKALEAAAEEIVKRTGWLRSDCEEITRAAVTAYLAEAGDGRLSELERENAALREALDEVARPMFHMRKRAEAEGKRLSDMAYNIAHSLDYVQGIARAALAGSGE
jgi:anti-sigma factor RsiW